MYSYYGSCPHWDCTNRNELGYCKTTCCINPKYQYNTYSTSTSADTHPTTYLVYTSDTTEENK